MKRSGILATLFSVLVLCGGASAQTKKPIKTNQISVQKQHLRAESQILVFLVEKVAIEMKLSKKQTEKLHRIAYFAEGKNPGDVGKMTAEIKDAKKNDHKVFLAGYLLYQRMSEILNGKTPKRTPSNPSSHEPKKTSST